MLSPDGQISQKGKTGRCPGNIRPYLCTSLSSSTQCSSHMLGQMLSMLNALFDHVHVFLEHNHFIVEKCITFVTKQPIMANWSTLKVKSQFQCFKMALPDAISKHRTVNTVGEMLLICLITWFFLFWNVIHSQVIEVCLHLKILQACLILIIL